MAATGAWLLQGPRLIPALSVVTRVAMTCVGAWWFADQPAPVSTSDARVRAHTVSLSSDIAGRIIDLPVRPGDAVTRGDVLVRLDDRRARLTLGSASLDLKALEVAIRRMSQQAELDRARGGSRIERAVSSLGPPKLISRARVHRARQPRRSTRESRPCTPRALRQMQRSSVRTGLDAAGVNAGSAGALALRQLCGAAWATSQLLAFRDCFLALGVAFLGIAPIASMLPGMVPARQIG